MDKGPGLFSYIGQKTRDILNKDYSKLKFSPHVSSGFAIRSASKNGVYMSTYSTQLKDGNLTADIKVKLRRDPNIFTTFIVDGRDLLPGLKAIVSFDILKPRSDMMGLQYQHDYAGINVRIMRLTGNPVFNFSGLLRNRSSSLGTDVSFDTKTGKFTTSGISFCYTDPTTTLALNNKGSTLSVSFDHKVHGNLSKNMNIIRRALASLSVIAVGAEATHNFSTNENSITIVTQFSLSCATTMKARFNSSGIASAAMRSKLSRNTFVTISGGVNTKASDKTPKFGVGFSTKF